MKGVAYEFMKKALAYADASIRSISKSLPEGMLFEGISRCTPLEEYLTASKPRENKRTFDLAQSNIYMVKLHFTLHGEQLKPVYVYFPYVEIGGTLMISGALFHLTPVLSDKVISPGRDSVFIRLLKDKITIRRSTHTVVIDGARSNVAVIWGNIYKRKKDANKVPPTTNANTVVAHYLFAKYGILEAFRRYADTDFKFGTKDINEENYPPSDWVIISSCRLKPKTSKDHTYIPTPIKIAILRHKWNAKTNFLAVGLFYIIDHFPFAFKAEESYFNQHSIGLCRRLLGGILKSGSYGHDKLLAVADEHFKNLDRYLDSYIEIQLKEIGLVFESFYDLLFHIGLNFSQFTNDAEQRILSMYSKTLEVVYNVLFDITSAMTNATYNFEKMHNKNRLTAAIAYDTLSKFVTTGKIFKLNSGKNVAEPVAYSGDHYYFKLACSVTDQETIPNSGSSKSKKGPSKKAKKIVGEDQHFHPSMLTSGSVLFLQKGDPTPITHLNPFAEIDMETGTLIPTTKFAKELEDLEKKLKEEIAVRDNDAEDIFDVSIED